MTHATPDPLSDPPLVEDPAAVRPKSAVRRTVASIGIDTSPLRESREFRLLFAGQGVSFAGSMITYVAVPFQAFALTRSSLVVGLVSLAELVPILLIAFVGGALADAFDRRAVVRLSELGLCAATVALLVNSALPHPRIWVLFIAVAFAAAADAVQRPSLSALVPRIISRDRLQAAVALESLRGNIGQVAGPPLAGVLIAAFGLPVTYGVDVASFAVSLAALTFMRAVPPPPEAERVSVAAVRAGLAYAWKRQDLLGTYVVDINATFFGMPMALFPQIAASLGGPAILGVMYTAPSVGALVASLTSGWTRRVHRHGRAIAVAAGVWGAAIILFGFSETLWVALLALAIAGAADMVSGLFRLTIWNQTIPDALRGRLAGVEMVSYTSGPALGNVEAGVVAAIAGVRASVVSGGVLCVLGTVALSAALPRFWRYRAG